MKRGRGPRYFSFAVVRDTRDPGELPALQPHSQPPGRGLGRAQEPAPKRSGFPSTPDLRERTIDTSPLAKCNKE